jgi:signal transduction histidine kinase
MESEKKSGFSLNTGTDLAFALVVFISFFTIFSSAPITDPLSMLLIIFLGIAYVTIGIYGFSYAHNSDSQKFKIIYFVIQLFFGGAIVYLGKGAGINALVLLPLVAHSAMMLDQDKLLIVNVGIIVTYIVSVFGYSHSLQEIWKGAPFFFAGQVVILIFTQMAVTELNARIRLQTLADELSEANKHLKEYADKVKDLTITQERNRMAREIHDGLGHYLTILNMQLKAASATLEKDKNKSHRMIESAIHLTSEALIDVRNSVFTLRQDPEEIEPLVERIRSIIESSKNNENTFTFTVLGNPVPLKPQIDLSLYRGVQEMVNNVIKHSKSKNAEIKIDYSDPDIVELTCNDDGIGNENFENGFGINGMNERVKLLNGIVKIITKKAKGYSISISIPR